MVACGSLYRTILIQYVAEYCSLMDCFRDVNSSWHRDSSNRLISRRFGDEVVRRV